MIGEISGLFLALGIFSVGFIGIGSNILAIIGTTIRKRETRRHTACPGRGNRFGHLGDPYGCRADRADHNVCRVCYPAQDLWDGVFVMFRLQGVSLRIHIRCRFKPRAAKGGNLYLQGLLIQMTDPKAALQWIAVVGLGLGADASLWSRIIPIVSTTLLSILGHLTYAITFSTRPVVQFYRGFRRWIESMLGLFFILRLTRSQLTEIDRRSRLSVSCLSAHPLSRRRQARLRASAFARPP